MILSDHKDHPSIGVVFFSLMSAVSICFLRYGSHISDGSFIERIVKPVKIKFTFYKLFLFDDSDMTL